MTSGLAVGGKVPVFVFPNEVKFYLNDQTSHKQTLTLYNPYDFPVRFKVLCTAPDKYQVVDPDGSIKPYCCIDLVVRHTAVNAVNCNLSDKFRIQMQDHATKQMIGKKDITASLLSEAPEERSTPERDHFEPLQHTWDRQSYQQYPMRATSSSSSTTSSNNANYIVLFTGLCCILTLLLPNEHEPTQYGLYASFNIKLIAAYVLGLVTMVVFRT